MNQEQLTKIKSTNFFRDFSDDILSEFSLLCEGRIFQKGQTIYLPGEELGKIFLILSGEVRIYQSAQGKKVVVQVLKKGDFFGDLSVAHDPYPILPENYASTDKESEVCIIKTGDLSAFIKRHPVFSLVLLTAVRNRLHQAESKIRDLALSSAETRIINELIRYAAHRGSRTRNGYLIEDKLTHQMLAEMAGVTRETATKSLQELINKGFIHYSDNRRIELDRQRILSDCITCVQIADKE